MCRRDTYGVERGVTAGETAHKHTTQGKTMVDLTQHIPISPTVDPNQPQVTQEELNQMHAEPVEVFRDRIYYPNADANAPSETHKITINMCVGGALVSHKVATDLGQPKCVDYVVTSTAKLKQILKQIAEGIEL